MIEICVRGADRYVGKVVEFTVPQGDGSVVKVRGELRGVIELVSGWVELMIESDGLSPWVVECDSNLWVDFDPIAARPIPGNNQNAAWVKDWSNE